MINVDNLKDELCKLIDKLSDDDLSAVKDFVVSLLNKDGERKEKDAYMTNLRSGIVYGVRHFVYRTAHMNMADIEILDFGNCFANQAKIVSGKFVNNGFSTTKTYDTLKESLNDIVYLIEEKIKEDPFVQNCEDQMLKR